MCLHELVEQSRSRRLLREFGLSMKGRRHGGLLQSDRGRLEGVLGLGEGVARHRGEEGGARGGGGDVRGRGICGEGEVVWGRILAANMLGLYRSEVRLRTQDNLCFEEGNKHPVISTSAPTEHLRSVTFPAGSSVRPRA